MHHIHKSRGPRCAQFLCLFKASGSANGFASRLLFSNNLFLVAEERLQRVLFERIWRAAEQELIEPIKLGVEVRASLVEYPARQRCRPLVVEIVVDQRQRLRRRGGDIT